ncbi:unnamed protein product [Peniophora sp. CBMAI 1063]|nr:unnamed protein product [Peniophora sp. CBMAI 1063]
MHPQEYIAAFALSYMASKDPTDMLQLFNVSHLNNDKLAETLVARGLEAIRVLARATDGEQVRPANIILRAEMSMLDNARPQLAINRAARDSFLNMFAVFRAQAPSALSLQAQRMVWSGLLLRYADYVPLWEVGKVNINGTFAWWLVISTTPIFTSPLEIPTHMPSPSSSPAVPALIELGDSGMPPHLPTTTPHISPSSISVSRSTPSPLASTISQAFALLNIPITSVPQAPQHAVGSDSAHAHNDDPAGAEPGEGRDSGASEHAPAACDDAIVGEVASHEDAEHSDGPPYTRTRPRRSGRKRRG